MTIALAAPIATIEAVEEWIETHRPYNCIVVHAFLELKDIEIVGKHPYEHIVKWMNVVPVYRNGPVPRILYSSDGFPYY